VRVMPECEVGREKKKIKKQEKKEKSNQALKLSHLDEDEDE